MSASEADNWKLHKETTFSSAEACDAQLMAMLKEDILSQKVGLKAKRKDESREINLTGNMIITKVDKNSSGKYERFTCDQARMLTLVSDKY